MISVKSSEILIEGIKVVVILDAKTARVTEIVSATQIKVRIDDGEIFDIDLTSGIPVYLDEGDPLTAIFVEKITQPEPPPKELPQPDDTDQGEADDADQGEADDTDQGDGAKKKQ